MSIKTWLRIGLVLLVAYVAWPYISLYRLAAALQTSDKATLDELVNWPSVREGLKSDLNAAMMKSAVDDMRSSSGGFGAALAATFMPMMIDKIVDAFVTPQGLTQLLQSERPTSAAAPTNYGSSSTVWSRVKERTHYAFFVGPTTFQLRIGEPGAMKNEQGIMIFRLEGLSWKLTRLYLPQSLMDMKNPN